MNSAPVSFTKITGSEVVGRLSHLTVGNEGFYVWAKANNPIRCKFVFFKQAGEEAKKIQIQLKVDQAFAGEAGQEIYFNFTIRETNFFGIGKIDVTSENALCLLVDPILFRAEKRRRERVIVFPHHKVFALFPDQNPVSEGNLLYINQASDKELQTFRHFVQQRLMTSDDGKWFGFRVLDISPGGISFLVNKIEKLYFERGKRFSLMIDFNGERYTDLSAEIVYVVDYIDPRATSILMFKLGMNFIDKNRDLDRKLQTFIGNDEVAISYSHEFVKFLKNS